uniref:Uncharacterized protein n=1 Tax=Panagrolaimus davidi TaxID=227884 RepID=A0A914QVF5_9BILA
MTIPQMAHYLGDLRAIYGVAENNNADEEPSRLILQAWLGANVGYVKDTRIFETPDFITAEKEKTLMILRKKKSVSSPTATFEGLSHFLSSSI